jgi:nucleoside-diphosphate-sugar epimerase
MSRATLHIAVTGSSGFIGNALVEMLRVHGHRVDAWSQASNNFRFRLEDFRDHAIATRWRENLVGVDVLIHTAARVHQLKEKNADKMLYRHLNAEAVRVLAESAQAAGVKRLIFFSSAKVYGEGGAVAYDESMRPEPEGAYAQSKLYAEQLLRELTGAGSMDAVILRPPLVYGPSVGGNFRRLWQLADSLWPLPLAGVANRRAMIALDNLTDITRLCCEDMRAGGNTFNIADAQPYSLAEIIKTIRQECGRRENLWRLPPAVLRGLIHRARGADEVQRLLGDFLVDIQQVQTVLDWEPRWDMAAVARQMRAKLPP